MTFISARGRGVLRFTFRRRLGYRPSDEVHISTTSHPSLRHTLSSPTCARCWQPKILSDLQTSASAPYKTVGIREQGQELFSLALYPFVDANFKFFLYHHRYWPGANTIIIIHLQTRMTKKIRSCATATAGQKRRLRRRSKAGKRKAQEERGLFIPSPQPPQEVGGGGAEGVLFGPGGQTSIGQVGGSGAGAGTGSSSTSGAATTTPTTGMLPSISR